MRALNQKTRGGGKNYFQIFLAREFCKNLNPGSALGRGSLYIGVAIIWLLPDPRIERMIAAPPS